MPINGDHKRAVEAVPPIEDRIEELAERLWTIREEDGAGALSIAASSLRVADLATVLQSFDDADRQRLVFLDLSPHLAAEVLEELDPEDRDQLLDATTDGQLVTILSEADADDAVYFLDHLDERAEALLARLDEQLRDQLAEQLELPEDTAGRLMQRSMATLRPFFTVDQAINRLRQSGKQRHEGPIYILDAESRLVGVLRFRDLLFADPTNKVGSLMEREPIWVDLTTDREEMVGLMQRYHLGAIPVVDESRHLRGMVTWDDAIDVLEAEADEDILALAGTSEDLEDNDGVIRRALLRMPYLVITVAGGFIVAKLIDSQSTELLARFPLLMAFLPLVPALGGNIGLQCSTVTVRSIATGEINAGRMVSRSVREVATGAVLALVMATVCGLGALALVLLGDQPPALSFVIASALAVAIVIAATMGVMIPLTCIRLGIDPAIAAGPFITMLNDVAGTTIYLLTASLLLN
jgi:magnesium transporter